MIIMIINDVRLQAQRGDLSVCFRLQELLNQLISSKLSH